MGIAVADDRRAACQCAYLVSQKVKKTQLRDEMKCNLQSEGGRRQLARAGVDQLSQQGVVDLSFDMTTNFRGVCPVAHFHRADNSNRRTRRIVRRYDDNSLQSAVAAADYKL